MKKKIIEIKNSLFGKKKDEDYVEPQDYIEISPNSDEKRAKIMVKYFVLTDFADIKPVIDSIRSGYTIAFIKIKPLKDKDITELKRGLDKIKKTVEVINGDLIGIEEDYIIATPGFASVARGDSGDVF